MDQRQERRLKAVPKSVTFKTAIEGSDRDVLEQMRTELAERLDNGVPAAYLAPVMRLLRDVDLQIRALDEKADLDAEEAKDGRGADRRTWDPAAI